MKKLPSNSDDILIQRTLSGDTSAFGDLVKKHQPVLQDVAFRMLRDQGEAEDVVQHVFIEAYRHLNDFRHSSQFSTWLYSITLNRVRNSLRRRRLRYWVPIEGLVTDEGDTPLQIADNKPTPDEIFERKSWVKWVREEIRLLPTSYRRIFVMHYIQEIPLDEIARRLNRPVGTIKVYLHRARKKIHQRAWKVVDRSS